MLTNRPYVLGFVGQNANGILRWGTEKLFACFEKYGLDHCVIDLLDPGWSTQLGNCLSVSKPAFCVSYQGLGTGIRAGDDENLWVRLGIPFITHIGDNPYHFPRQHCADGPGIYRLFACEDFLDTYVRYFKDRAYAEVLVPGYPENPYADRTAWKEREHDIVFVKTGADSKSLRQNWQAFPSRIRGILEDTVELVLGGENATVASLCEQVFRSRNIEWGDRTEFFFSVCSMADFYVRAVKAERMVSALLRYDALIIGDWPSMDGAKARARFAAPVAAAELDDLYARSRVVVNTLPATRYGMHERIPAGFHAKAAVLSDSTPYLDNALREYPSFFGVDCDEENFADRVDQAMKRALDAAEIEEKIQVSAARAREQFSFDGFAQSLMDCVALDKFRRAHDAWRIPPKAKQPPAHTLAQPVMHARELNEVV